MINRRILCGLSTCTLLGSLPLSAQETPTSQAADGQTVNLSYVGGSSRIGVGAYVDQESTTHFRGDLLHVFSESPGSAWIGEGWFADRAGGLKLNYHWTTPYTKGAEPSPVQKLFMALDQNKDQDRKLSLGYGQENEHWFWGANLSKGLTGDRRLSQSSSSQDEIITGVENGHEFFQTITTTTTTRVFEKAYDYGVGGRIGHFFQDHLVKAHLGVDYEWGDYGSRQTTLSVGLEKLFHNSPHSLAILAETYDKSGDFEQAKDDSRVSLMYRYEFGGKPNFRAETEYREVKVAAAEAAPTSEKRLVKTTVSMAPEYFFDLDSAKLTSQGLRELDKVAGMLKESGFVGNLRITGNTCDLGSSAYNQKLSERRAASVKTYLASRGLSTEVMITRGLGETAPKYPANAKTRYKNRRVDLEYVSYESNWQEVPLASEPRMQVQREVIDQEPTWVRRALHNPVPHKQIVDTYRFEKQRVSVTEGEKVFLNKRPEPQDDVYSLLENAPATQLNTLANDQDPDGDALTIVAVGQPSNGSVVNGGTSLTYTPNRNFVGSDSMTYTVSDGRETAVATVRITVTPANRSPVAADDVASTVQGQSVNISVLDNDQDPDGDPLSLQSVTQPGHGSASVSGNKVLYTPAAGFTGTDSFNYSIADGKGGTASAKVTVTVLAPANRPPVAVDDVGSTPFGQGVRIPVLENDQDPDGDALSIQSVTQPRHGSAAISGDTVLYIPLQGFTGADSFTYVATDGKGGTATATVRVTVLDQANNPPIAEDDFVTMLWNRSVDIEVLLNDRDPDGDRLEVTSFTQPQSGTAAYGPGTKLRYTPNPGFWGTDQFNYSISDGKGGTASAKVTISVVDP